MTMAQMIQLLVRGLIEPRATARFVLGTAHPLPAIVMLICFDYLVWIAASVLIGAVQAPEGGSVLGFHIQMSVLHVMQFIALSTLLYWGARAAGGAGSRLDTFLIVAWHMAVTSPVAALIGKVAVVSQDAAKAAIAAGPGALPDISPAVVLIGFAGVCFWLWLLAVYIAEAHGFRSAGRVLGSILAAMVLLSMVVALMVGPA